MLLFRPRLLLPGLLLLCMSRRFGGFGGSSLVSSIIFAALTIGYFAVMDAQKGQTVGKMGMGLKVVGPDGTPVGDVATDEGPDRLNNADHDLALL